MQLTRSRGAQTIVMALLVLMPARWAAAADPRPNFLFIFGEGQGWTSTSVPMDDALPASKGEIVRTPNLERMAARGMRFANAYAPSPRCTPSRASVFTGKSPAQLHMTFVNDRAAEPGRLATPRALMDLPAHETTIGELLQQAGYATAQFGKWHVGRVSPKREGYDETDGPNGNGGPENVETPNPKQAQAITRLGVDFMTRQAKAGKPFYLQICHYAPRSALGVRSETLETISQRAASRGGARSRDRNLIDIAAMEDMDATIGTLLDTLEALAIADRTYVIYMPDHGTPGRNVPLSGGKGGIWDGGLRVPLLIAGPGVVHGGCSHVRVSGMDLFPTIAEFAGVRQLPPGLEGGSLAAVLKGDRHGSVQRMREEFVVHFPHYDKDPDGPASAIYLQDFKLMRFYESGERRLFDLSKDIGERNDIAKQSPEKVKELDDRLTAYLKTVNAQMPGDEQTVPKRRPDTAPRGNRQNQKER